MRFLKRTCAIVCAALMLMARANADVPYTPPPFPDDLPPFPLDPPGVVTDPFPGLPDLPDPIDIEFPPEDPNDDPFPFLPDLPDPIDEPDPFPDLPSLFPDPLDDLPDLPDLPPFPASHLQGPNPGAHAAVPHVVRLLPFPMRLAFPPALIPNGPTAKPTGRKCDAAASTIVVPETNRNTIAFVATCPWAVTKHLAVGTAPVKVAFTPDGTTILVANSGSGSISFVDTVSQTVTATLPLPSFNGDRAMPNNIVITSDGTRAYVTDHDGNPGSLVYILDLTHKAVTGQINVGAYPSGSALSPDESQLWVNCRNDNVINVIDTLTNTVIASMRLPSPTGIAFNPTGTRVYAASAVGMTDYIAVIDPSTFSVMTTIPVGNLPHIVKVTPTGRHLFVTNALSNSISQIDTNTNKVVRTIMMPKGLQHPLGLTFIR